MSEQPTKQPADAHVRWLRFHLGTNVFGLLVSLAVMLQAQGGVLFYVMLLPAMMHSFTLGFQTHATWAAKRYRASAQDFGNFIEHYLLDAVNGAVEADRARRQRTPPPPEVN